MTFAALAGITLSAEQEQRAQALFGTLHCMVCNGQSLAESNAMLAADMRQLVRERIADGQSDDEITTFLVERYGDGILLEPPVKPYTYLLWASPFLLMLIAVAVAWPLLFRRESSK